jgi:hypothetical protein
LARRSDIDYRARVVVRFARRVVWGGLTFFALLGFVSVPLGRKSGWEHLKAIMRSPECEQALNGARLSLAPIEERLARWLPSWVMREATGRLLPQPSANSPDHPLVAGDLRAPATHQLPHPHAARPAR